VPSLENKSPVNLLKYPRRKKNCVDVYVGTEIKLPSSGVPPLTYLCSTVLDGPTFFLLSLFPLFPDLLSWSDIFNFPGYPECFLFFFFNNSRKKKCNFYNSYCWKYIWTIWYMKLYLIWCSRCEWKINYITKQILCQKFQRLKEELEKFYKDIEHLNKKLCIFLSIKVT
jgi:hypothetical protein